MAGEVLLLSERAKAFGADEELAEVGSVRSVFDFVPTKRGFMAKGLATMTTF